MAANSTTSTGLTVQQTSPGDTQFFIPPQTITSSMYSPGSVNNAALGSQAVQTANILPANITLSTLAQEVINYLIPTGTILAYGGNTAPSGYLVCDGSSLPVQNYSALALVIGGSFGTAGALYFNLPDLRGKFLRGRGFTTAQDPDIASRSTGTGYALNTPYQTYQTQSGTAYMLGWTGNLAAGMQATGTFPGIGFNTYYITQITGNQVYLGSWNSSTGVLTPVSFTTTSTFTPSFSQLGGVGWGVGSGQSGQFGQHNHSFPVTDPISGVQVIPAALPTPNNSLGNANFSSNNLGNGLPYISKPVSTAAYNLWNQGGSETRPVNVYTNYIIKY